MLFITVSYYFALSLPLVCNKLPVNMTRRAYDRAGGGTFMIGCVCQPRRPCVHGFESTVWLSLNPFKSHDNNNNTEQ